MSYLKNRIQLKLQARLHSGSWLRYVFFLTASPGLWLLVCLPLMGGCSWFFEEANKEVLEDMKLDLPRIPYTTKIKLKKGEEFIKEVDDHLKAVSLLIKLEKHPSTSLHGLHQRIKNDIARLKEALAEKGYFDGQVDFMIKDKISPIKVTLTYSHGERYRLSKITVLAVENSREPLPISQSKAAKFHHLNVDDEVDLNRIQEANLRLAKYLRDHGYPFVEMAEPEAEIDRDAKRLHILFRADSGYHSFYGKTDIEGLKNLNPQFVRNRFDWKEGESFDERELDNTNRKLMGTGLFSGVEIKPDEEASKSKVVPLKVRVTEGPPRTIGAGLKYATTEGFGGQAFWSNRNVFGSGENLGALLRISPKFSRAKIDLDIPDIFVPEQHLRSEISGTREKNRAYTSRSLDAGMRLEHPFSETIKGLVGITGEVGKSKRADMTYLNRWVGLPLELQIDESNDLIDPTKGGRLSVEVTPYFGKSGFDRRILISTAKGSYYLRLMKNGRAVVAGWAHGGTIGVSSISNLSPNKRFYAGGVGSVRGYGYKLLGPLDTSRIPLGGRSILEYGLEGRFKVTDTIGFVVFAEAGTVSGQATPDLSSQARLWGVGAGLRYYTSVGPIRFDVAMPMKRRRDGSPKPIDSAYQFYISIGQAF